MKAKPKKCKGINKARGVDGCGVETLNRKNGLCPSCLYEWYTTTELGKIMYNKQFLPKVKQVVERRKKIEHKALKDKLTNWSSKLQDEVNKIVRLIDKDLPCLARKTGGQMHAGHVFARGGNQTIRYNLHNIHRQCARSNHFQNDDGLLREGIVEEYGSDYMAFISELRKTPALNLSNSEYKELYYKAKKIVLRLKKADLNYSLDNRIIIRNKINKELGVYSLEFCIFV